MTRRTASTLYGNLDLLVLHTLSVVESTHGLGIMDTIEQRSNGSILVEDGAIYRSLHRLEEHGLLGSEWRISDKNRKAKFYSLTPAGKKELVRALSEWKLNTRAVGQVLGLRWELSS